MLCLSTHFQKLYPPQYYLHIFNFKQSFESLERLLITRDLPTLESIFTCLSRLVKLSNRYLRDDLAKVVSIFIRLVSNEKREYIRNFAGDAFSFLLRKQSVSQPEKTAEFWEETSVHYESDEKALGKDKNKVT